ncbi:hypothetical protein G6F40_015374 [Rhizopus arrhizus]|nr:hypothetical protein G6F40_015374 [Rhizopus arrhizus]
MARDHGGHPVADEGGLDFGRGHVGHRLELRTVVLLHLGLARLAGELRLERRVARLRTELLVGDVIGAQQVTVLQQHRAAVQLDHARVGQDAQAGTACVVLAEQEVAVAADEVHRHAAVGQHLQRIGHRVGGRRGGHQRRAPARAGSAGTGR